MSTYDDDGFIIEHNALVAYKGDEEHVIIPDGVWTIKERAFLGNDRIRTIDLNEVARIDDEAFACCSALETVIPHKDLQGIGNRAFAGCRSLRSIRHAQDEEWPDVLNLGVEAFAECASLESLDLYGVVVWLEVGDRCFLGCTALTSVVFGEALAELGDNVFEGCTALECISLPMALRNQIPGMAERYESVLQTIRDGCPNLQVLERRQPITVRAEDENHELWETEEDSPP